MTLSDLAIFNDMHRSAYAYYITDYLRLHCFINLLKPFYAMIHQICYDISGLLWTSYALCIVLSIPRTEYRDV